MDSSTGLSPRYIRIAIVIHTLLLIGIFSCLVAIATKLFAIDDGGVPPLLVQTVDTRRVSLQS
jgi:hypothetical protein